MTPAQRLRAVQAILAAGLPDDAADAAIVRLCVGEPPSASGDGIETFSPARQGGPITESDLTDVGREILAELRRSRELRQIATLRVAEQYAARVAEGAYTAEQVRSGIRELGERIADGAAAGAAPKSREQLAAMLGGFVRNVRPHTRTGRGVQGDGSEIEAIMARQAARAARAATPQNTVTPEYLEREAKAQAARRAELEVLDAAERARPPHERDPFGPDWEPKPDDDEEPPVAAGDGRG